MLGLSPWPVGNKLDPQAIAVASVRGFRGRCGAREGTSRTARARWTRQFCGPSLSLLGRVRRRRNGVRPGKCSDVTRLCNSHSRRRGSWRRNILARCALLHPGGRKGNGPGSALASSDICIHKCSAGRHQRLQWLQVRFVNISYGRVVDGGSPRIAVRSLAHCQKLCSEQWSDPPGPFLLVSGVAFT